MGSSHRPTPDLDVVLCADRLRLRPLRHHRRAPALGLKTEIVGVVAEKATGAAFGRRRPSGRTNSAATFA
ncbi:MAG: hypothetical protein R3D85_17215 [Paracoccaceae bacterium]